MLTVKEAAKHLGVSPSLLYQMAAMKEIPHYRVHSRILFCSTDLDAFVARCRIAPGSPSGAPVRRSEFRQLNAEKLMRAWKKQGAP